MDVLKLDVEGSEFLFLEEALDASALRGVDQLTLEWHHYGDDLRYGAGSSPSINALSTVRNSKPSGIPKLAETLVTFYCALE